jgi:deazaflavin-dependent oxidoreductase (nitroreductase family)
MVSLQISPYDEANAFFRIMRRSAGWLPLLLLYERILPPADRLVFRVTSGRRTFIGLVTGLPALMLTTTGVRSGAQRTHPLAYLGKDGDFVVIGANWGKPRNPQWYYNLRANPEGDHVGIGIVLRRQGPRGNRTGARSVLGVGLPHVPALEIVCGTFAPRPSRLDTGQARGTNLGGATG